MKRTILTAAILCLSTLPLGQSVTAAAQDVPSCSFQLGFAALHDAAPRLIGDCLADEQYDASGSVVSFQPTTRGLLVWRKADNWTGFTDGYRTWISTEDGLQRRLNTDRYVWESDAGAPGTSLIAQVSVAGTGRGQSRRHHRPPVSGPDATEQLATRTLASTGH